MKRIFYILFCILLMVSAGSCEPEFVDGSGTPQTPVEPEGGDNTGGGDQGGTEEDTIYPAAASGISVEPKVPDADQSCLISFKPSASNKLYNYSGDLYAHLGVVIEGEWEFVPAGWDQNLPKCKFTKVADNSWELELKPSIREFFNTGTTPVNMIAIIVRSDDGTMKSHDADQFCTVKDNKYKPAVFEPDEVVVESMPAGLVQGINIHDDNSVTFVLYEKDKKGSHYDYCYVVGDWNDWTRVSEGAMKRDDEAGCWWLKVEGFDPDQEYRFQYRLGNPPAADIYVSDPYTRIVYDQWNDQYIPGVREFPENAKAHVSAFQIDMPEFAWQHDDFEVEDKNDLVIYEMLFRDFSTTKDIAGAMAQLDYIENLGVNAIELMPIHEFDGNLSWGYNPNHYYALDKAYGTREQYKQFIDECHKRGLAVIVDVVYNHAYGSHTWAKMYWDANNNRTASQNPWFNAVAMHPFNVGHDFNHENPMVKEHVKGSLRYLLEEYHVDGFRFDLTKGFTQKNSGTSEANAGQWGKYDQSRVDILKDYADAIWEVDDNAVVIFEHLSDWDEEKVLADYGIQLWRNVNHEYRTAVNGGSGNFENMYSTAPFGGFVGYMESHDEERLCYGATDEVASITWGVIGIGDKWGATDDWKMVEDGVFVVARNVTCSTNDRFKIRKFNDSSWNDAYNYGASSENFKLPVGQPYELTLGSGSKDLYIPAAGTYDIYFCPKLKTIWLMPAGSRPEEPSVDSQDALSVAMRRAASSAAFFLTVPGPKMIWQFGEIGYDYSINYNDRTGEKPVVTSEYMAVPQRKALYDTYAGLIRFRRENPRFFDSDASFKWTPNGDLKTISCTADGKSFYVVGNFSSADKTVTVTLPSGGTWKNWFDGSETYSGTSVSVPLTAGDFRLLVNF